MCGVLPVLQDPHKVRQCERSRQQLFLANFRCGLIALASAHDAVKQPGYSLQNGAVILLSIFHDVFDCNVACEYNIFQARKLSPIMI